MQDKKELKHCSGKRSKLFASDVILKQQFFEPVEWEKPIKKQIEILKRYLPEMELNSEYIRNRISKKSPKGFVKIAIPKMDYLGRINNADPYLEIGVLIEQACDLIGKQRKNKFTHYRKGRLSSSHIRCIRELVKKRKRFEKSVPGDILILDVSLGTYYVGWTPRGARENIISNENQLALSSVDLAWILLVNPKRFRYCDDLSVDSVMEEYFSQDRKWECVLFFYFRGGKLEFGYRWGRRAYFDSGAAIATFNKLNESTNQI